MELTKSELKLILEWFSLADSYLGERGHDLLDEDYELKENISNRLEYMK